MKKKKNKKLNTKKRDGRKTCFSTPKRASKKTATQKRPFKATTMLGRIDGTSKGYAFFVPDDGSGDLFIPASKLYGAIHGDVVEVIKTSEHKGAGEGEVYRVISRENQTFVGEARNGYVIPDLSGMPSKIKIDKKLSVRFSTGDKVVARMMKTGADGEFTCRITETLGLAGNTDVEVLSIIRSYKIEEHFPPKVIREAERLDDQITPEIKMAREDFTSDTVITIDGATSKDFDDAVCVKRTANGYRLYVHIADVAEYVKLNGAIDKEAFKRGTSVYFSDRVIPMLPEKLCNDLCSLVEGENRLTLSCIMDINEEGEVTSSRIVEGVIRSVARTTYDEVYAIMQGDREMRERYAGITGMLDDATALYRILEKKRIENGSIEFELPESVIEVDERGNVTDVRLSQRNDAHKLIEEFMLIANKTVAKTFDAKKVPFVYRVHAVPPEEKEQTLREFLRPLGIELPSPVTPKAIADMLVGVKQEYAETVSMVTLRSMSKAEYKPTNDGHFGLSFADYCHFTSPIRRYPDLAIHRIIKLFIKGGKQTVEILREWVKDVSLQSSKTERVAEEAERKVDDLLKAKFMEDKIGMRFKATVSGVTEWGLFARLDNGVEGCIRVEKLSGGLYVFDQANFRLSCGKKSYKLGDSITVEVDDVEAYRVNFSVVDDLGE